MKVRFETFGCRLSRAEALQQEAEYLAGGWEVTEKNAEADLIIVRGCSVTARAQRECEKRIAHLKKRYPLKKFIITGCLTKAEKFPPKAPLAVPVRTARAYLKIQDGCSGRCTFCIVPQFRGTSVSVDFTALVDQARRFIDAGYHEIVLTGCNLSLYASQGKRLAELVDALAALDENRRIRLGSVEPGAAALDLVEVMASHGNICRFLHIPVQSGSNRMLSAMRRPYLVRDVEALVKKAVAAMPFIGLGCDLMTGFPSETDADFTMTQGLLKRLNFSNAHIFPYSERPGTIAAGYPDALPRELRRHRAHELAAIAAVYRRRAAEKFLGKDVEMIVEDEENRTGWTGEYFPCKVTTARNEALIKRKQLVKVHVMDVKGDVLKGVVI